MNRTTVQREAPSVVTKPFRPKWRSHYEASPDLRSVNETLNKEWQLFKQSLVREQQERDARKQRSFRRRIFKKNAEQKNPHWRVDSKAGQPLGIEDIIASVDDARSYWESKPRLAHGKAQNGFHTFCKTVDAHSNLMKCLPEQSQYLSVFCGVTTTLIKASVNHQNIAEILGNSLSEINGSLKDCEEVVELMSTNDMHEAISFLYAHVFHFLASAIRWYQACTSKRILNSLTEDFSDNFKAQVSKIKEMCNLICRKGTIKSQAELRELRVFVEEKAARDVLAREEAREAERKIGISMAHMEVFGQQIVSTLRENTQAWLHKDEGEIPEHASSGLSTRRLTEKGEEPSATKVVRIHEVAVTTTRSELQQWSANLEDFTSNILEFLNQIDFSTAFAELGIIEAIRDWSQSSYSQALWVQGRFQESYPSDATAIAAKLIATARAMAIPVLCFFFNIDDTDEEDPPRMMPRPYESRAEAMAVDFVYSLIRQLIDQLPGKVKLSRKRLEMRLERLDGSLQTIDTALKILEELLGLAPATLLVIVDGVEQTAESDAEATVSKVLLMLQHLTAETRKGKVTKVLYTTAGTSDALEDLDEVFLNKFEAEEGRPKHMKERLRSLEDFSFDSDTTITSTDTDGTFSDDERSERE